MCLIESTVGCCIYLTSTILNTDGLSFHLRFSFVHCNFITCSVPCIDSRGGMWRLIKNHDPYWIRTCDLRIRPHTKSPFGANINKVFWYRPSKISLLYLLLIYMYVFQVCRAVPRSGARFLWYMLSNICFNERSIYVRIVST